MIQLLFKHIAWWERDTGSQSGIKFFMETVPIAVSWYIRTCYILRESTGGNCASQHFRTYYCKVCGKKHELQTQNQTYFV